MGCNNNDITIPTPLEPPYKDQFDTTPMEMQDESNESTIHEEVVEKSNTMPMDTSTCADKPSKPTYQNILLTLVPKKGRAIEATEWPIYKIVIDESSKNLGNELEDCIELSE